MDSIDQMSEIGLHFMLDVGENTRVGNSFRYSIFLKNISKIYEKMCILFCHAQLQRH